MAKKPPATTTAKCKAPAPPTAPAYGRPWMAALVAAAAASGDLRSAAAKAGVSLLDVARARASDLAFDAAMTEVDQSIRLAAIVAVETLAAAGDLKAIRAMTDGSLDRLRPGGSQDPLVIEVPAVIPERTDPLQCPHCAEWIELTTSASWGTVHLDARGVEFSRDDQGVIHRDDAAAHTGIVHFHH